MVLRAVSAGGREGRALCAVMCCVLLVHVCDVCWRLKVVLYALEMLEGMPTCSALYA